mmetsp:Transcript_44682/g.132207  ORF Transcript_44682/g.132207 Transcript_44682/m.132207 type:complete len:246 (+) Transcript_44682:1098-1835(+)
MHGRAALMGHVAKLLRILKTAVFADVGVQVRVHEFVHEEEPPPRGVDAPVGVQGHYVRMGHRHADEGDLPDCSDRDASTLLLHLRHLDGHEAGPLDVAVHAHGLVDAPVGPSAELLHDDKLRVQSLQEALLVFREILVRLRPEDRVARAEVGAELQLRPAAPSHLFHGHPLEVRALLQNLRAVEELKTQAELDPALQVTHRGPGFQLLWPQVDLARDSAPHHDGEASRPMVRALVELSQDAQSLH